MVAAAYPMAQLLRAGELWRQNKCRAWSGNAGAGLGSELWRRSEATSAAVDAGWMDAVGGSKCLELESSGVRWRAPTHFLHNKLVHFLALVRT